MGVRTGLAIAATLASSQGAVPTAGGLPHRFPALVIEQTGQVDAALQRLGEFEPARLTTVVQLVGLSDPGPPIHVVVAGEATGVARSTPHWIVGFAEPERDLVVIFADRTPAYPYSSLESVLFHEVAHVVVARAAGGRGVPRWFDEGLATVAERGLDVDDRTRAAWVSARMGRMSPDELDGLFGGGARSAEAAYALSTSLVARVFERHGHDAIASILEGRRRGMTFDAAFAAATGTTLEDEFDTYWNPHSRLERWIPTLTSSFTIWTLVTLLALAAIVRHQIRRARKRRAWDDEESGYPRLVPDPGSERPEPDASRPVLSGDPGAPRLDNDDDLARWTRH